MRTSSEKETLWEPEESYLKCRSSPVLVYTCSSSLRAPCHIFHLRSAFQWRGGRCTIIFITLPPFWRQLRLMNEGRKEKKKSPCWSSALLQVGRGLEQDVHICRLRLTQLKCCWTREETVSNLEVVRTLIFFFFFSSSFFFLSLEFIFCAFNCALLLHYFMLQSNWGLLHHDYSCSTENSTVWNRHLFRAHPRTLSLGTFSAHSWDFIRGEGVHLVIGILYLRGKSPLKESPSSPLRDLCLIPVCWGPPESGVWGF